MRPSHRRKIPFDNEPSPSEKRELMRRGEGEEDEEGGDEARSRAPLVFRLLAWTSLVLIFFAVGYGATSLAFKWLDKSAYERGAARTPPNLADTSEDARDILSRTPGRGDSPLSADSTAQVAGAYVTVTI